MCCGCCMYEGTLGAGGAFGYGLEIAGRVAGAMGFLSARMGASFQPVMSFRCAAGSGALVLEGVGMLLVGGVWPELKKPAGGGTIDAGGTFGPGVRPYGDWYGAYPLPVPPP